MPRPIKDEVGYCICSVDCADSVVLPYQIVSYDHITVASVLDYQEN